MGSNPTEIVPHNPYLCVLKDGLNWLPILGHKTWEMRHLFSWFAT